MTEPIVDTLTSPAAPVAETADTLAAAAETDTLFRPAVMQTIGRLSDLTDRTADSLSAAEPFDPVLTAEQAFGPDSELVAGTVTGVPYSEALTDHPLFQIGRAHV